MPTLVFTAGDDSYTVAAAGTYDLSFLAGADTLTVNGGTFTTAHLGDGNDVAELRAGDASVFGELGNDRFEIYAAGIEADGGGGADIFNVRGAANITLAGGDGADRFNFAGAAAGALIHGGLGDDSFAGYDMAIGGSIFGDAGNDTFTGFRSGVTLNGGVGNDIYRLNTVSNATFTELAGQGTDIVQLMRGADYTLPDNIERIIVGTYAGSDASSATITLNLLDNGFTGHGNAETVFGLGGVDRLFGKAGDDTLYGGDGNDLVDGGAGNDTLEGGAGNDSLVGRAGDDLMSGGAGNDIYYVDSLGDVIGETTGTDIARVSVTGYALAANVEIGVVNSAAGLSLSGNDLANQLFGGAGGDTLAGLDGNDTLKGGAGVDTLGGGAGNDILIGGAGDDAMTGGAGDDTYHVDTLGDTVTESAGEGTDSVIALITGVTLAPEVENGIVGLSTGLTLTGNLLFNTITGGNGADELYGLAGNDHLIGGGGNDELFAGSSEGTSGTDGDTLEGGTGNDILHGSEGGIFLSGGDDIIDGGTGDDTMSGLGGDDTYYVDSLADVVFEELNDGFDRVIVSVDNYFLGANVEGGTVAVDTGLTLTGNERPNSLGGGGGDDFLIGGIGADRLNGGAGNDILDGGNDDDDFSGSAGDDTMYGGDGNDEFFDQLGTNTAYGGAGDDRYVLEVAGTLQIVENAGEGTDYVQVQIANYTLPANVENAGIAILNGTLHGNAGANALTGNNGNDLLDGGGDADSLSGLNGNDTFDYNDVSDSAGSYDTIQDFTVGSDKIDVSTIDAVFNEFVKGNEAFTFTTSTLGGAGKLWVVADAGNLYHVYADVDGHGADMRIDVISNAPLSASDFVL